MNGSRWVIDASVLAKVYLKDEQFSSIADDVVSRFVLGDLELVAPQIILYEIPRAIRSAVRLRRLDVDRGRQPIDDFLALDVPVLGTASTLHRMIRSAFELAIAASCRFPDALYLLVAQGSGYPLLTADRRLFEGARRVNVPAMWIEDVPPS